MELVIVIVNYGTAGMVMDCLRALVPQLRRGEIEAIVTDNASPDDSVARLSRGIEENGWGQVVRLLPLSRNGGFAFGNNAGIRAGLAADDQLGFVMLLNPDTIPRADAVKRLLGFMRQHENVGIAGSRLEDRDGTAQRSAFRFHSLASEFENAMRLGPVSRALARQVVAPPVPEYEVKADWVAGASMMIRRSVIEKVGLMDEGYFMYFEEVDYCKRAGEAGFSCWYVPTSRVVHLVGQASGVTVTRVRPARRPGYWFASRSRYFARHHGRIKKVFIDTAWVVGFLIFKVRAMVQGKAVMDPPHLLKDFVRYNFVPGVK